MSVDTPGNTDWANVPGVNTGIDKTSGSTDNAFGQGTKEDNSAVTIVTGSIPPNKNDLTRFYEASETAANGHTYLYLGWERLVNIGNANLDFEISQNPTAGFTADKTGAITLNRTAGDLLVTYDFGGSGTPTLGINTWLTAAAGNKVSECYSANALPCWGNHTVLNGADSQGAVNAVAITDPLNNNAALGVGLFGEAAIDLTTAGVIPPGTCEAFGSTFVKSRSSSSFTAEIKDFIAPIPVNISNCGSITIKKVTTNAPSGDTTSFAYTTSANLSGFSLKNGDSKTFSALPAGNYSVTEGAQTAPWSFVDLTCDTSSGVSIDKTTQTVSIALATSENVTCTYTNHYTNSPTIKTTLSSGSVTVGSAVHDSATLSGASATASGSVTYNVYTDNECKSLLQSAGTKTVTNGLVPDSDAVTFTSAGDYYWQAVYTSDNSDNNGATSVCTDEHLVVNKAQPAASTAQDLIPNDSFTLSNGYGTPTGSITFSLYSPANVNNATCTGTADYTEKVTVNGNGTYSTGNGTTVTPAFHATAEGTWNWTSSYSGDSNNLAATSACGVEHFTIANK
jgi:hypothetical protein